VVIGTGSQGGVAVPEEIRRDVERLELKFSPVRSLVNVVQIGTGDVKELVNIRGATATWTNESGVRSQTNTPLLRENTLTGGELFAYVRASQWSLDDMFFDVKSWLTEECAQQFAPPKVMQ
jgi:HK97 family phage major capsid protein